jgi:hypothetical protein
MYIFDAFIETPLALCMWVYLLFHWFLCLSLYQYHTVGLLWLCSMSWNQVLWRLQLCPFVQVCFGYSGFLRFHMNIKIPFSSSVKNFIIIMNGIEFVNYFWYYDHFSNINSSNPRT